ncbi:MAG: GTPase ObgE [Microbacteriaceae bacterium]|nr:GTPase ObgE [Microbacteriaceae bacterium]
MVSFIDEVTVHLKAGHGGNGCVSVKREKFKPLAGPDGGNGGNGGDIILVSDPQVTTLLDFHYRPHRSSENGGFGMGDHRSGHKGETLTLPVPVGTVVKDVDGVVIVDLDKPAMEFVVAPGGQGGLGNSALASQKRKAPGFALLGTYGWDGDVVLELKTVADVALVGFPSAGKSSLIASVSAAKPKIADYPFTTLHPNLGVVDVEQYRYTIADVPGLIEGASDGKGLGLDFLRHVERCRVLVHVIDCATLEPGRDPLSDFDVIRAELAAYPVPDGAVPLIERPQIIALNKIDVPEAAELAELVRTDFEDRGFDVFVVSAASRAGLRELTLHIGQMVGADRAERLAAEESQQRIVIRPRAVDEKQLTVLVEQRGDDVTYRVRGAKPERWVQQTDFNNDEAVGYLSDRLAKIDLDDQLYKAGATPGATVFIGDDDRFVFDWEPTMTSAAEMMVSPRGTDMRLDDNTRTTNVQRRQSYKERMDAKTAAREELERERVAGMWTEEDEGGTSK